MTKIDQTELASIVAEDSFIASDTAGISLHLRRKRLRQVERFSAEQTVLFMHGATFSSASLFDVPVNGGSFMDILAARGFDVYGLDVRGYGRSTQSPATTEPGKPLVRTATAVRDLAAAVNSILDQRQITHLNLVAMSWGGSVAGAYAASPVSRVQKLALIAPLWLTQTPARIDQGGTLGAYREIDVQKFEDAWRAAAPEDQRETLIPAGCFAAWAQITLDANSAGIKPGSIRVPSGAVLDIREFWTAGKPLYDPAEIKVPVLLVHAEWDVDVTRETTQHLFSCLTGAPYRRWIEIGEGTHMVLLEKNRWQAVAAVTEFLEEILPVC